MRVESPEFFREVQDIPIKKMLKKKTNIDKIRTMSDEELASFLNTVNMATCSYVMRKSPCDGENCPCWLNWLNQEV